MTNRTTALGFALMAPMLPLAIIITIWRFQHPEMTEVQTLIAWWHWVIPAVAMFFMGAKVVYR